MYKYNIIIYPVYLASVHIMPSKSCNEVRVISTRNSVILTSLGSKKLRSVSRCQQTALLVKELLDHWDHMFGSY